MKKLIQFIRKKIYKNPEILKVANNFGWLFFDKVIRMGVGLFVSLWLARYLGPEGYGIISFSNSLVNLIGVLAGLGLQSIVIKSILKEPNESNKILGTAAILMTFGGIASYLIATITACIIRSEDNQTIMIVAILGLMLLTRPFDIATIWFESKVLSKGPVIAQSIVSIIFAIIKSFLIIKNYGLIAFAWITVAEVATTSIVVFILFNNVGINISKLKFSISTAKTLIVDAWPLLLANAATLIYMRIDQLMIGEMINDREVGIYSAAIRISEIWYMIPMMIVSSIAPSIISAHKNNKTTYLVKMQHLYDFMSLSSILFAIPVTFLSGLIINTLFGDKYADATLILQIHIWTGLFVALAAASNQSYILENQSILSFQRTLLGAIINVVLNLYLIPIYAGMGAAVATLIAQVCVGLFFDMLQKSTRHIFIMKVNALNPMRLVLIYNFFIKSQSSRL